MLRGLKETAKEDAGSTRGDGVPAQELSMIQRPHLDRQGTAASGLIPLFHAALEFRSESPADAVVPPDEREGVYLGSGDGVCDGLGAISTLAIDPSGMYPPAASGTGIRSSPSISVRSRSGRRTTMSKRRSPW